jgi:L-ascorbate metabolism protein UlaG (beta-lactamase superfamily)
MSDALDAFYAISVNPGQIVVLWLVNGAPSGVLLKTSQKAFLVDPAGAISGSDVNKVQRLDVLLITHEHSDHFQKSATLAIQAKTGAAVVVNPGVFMQLSGAVPSDKLIKMRSLETQNVDGVKIIAVASIHPATEPLTYLVLADFPFFHGSDSGYNSALTAYKSFVKLAIVPTGVPSPTASPHEALNMVKALEPTDAAAVHGSVAQNNEFASLLAQQAPNVRYHALTAASSVMVGEFSGMKLIALAVTLAMSILILRGKRRETSKTRESVEVAPLRT